MIEETIFKLPNQRSQIKWSVYLATAYAEQFNEGENATAEEQIEAWAVITMTGVYNALQGFYGRTVHQLLEKGIIDEDGKINWDIFEE